jgi:ubiquitin-protein ligase
MAPQMATSRLRKELTNLKKDPPPGIIAEPEESDILTWHYAIKGPSETPFESGTYVGKIKFPSQYPMKPPSIMMLTPSGRFAVNTRLCLSMSDFHPETWNPMWSVSSILQGVQSFMASEELTTGGMKATDSERKAMAEASMAYNKKIFAQLFDGDIDTAFLQAEEARIQSAKTSLVEKSAIRRRVPPTTELKELDINDQLEEPKEELTLEELEKRKKRNAKKRSKQKAKKRINTATEEEEEEED